MFTGESSWSLGFLIMFPISAKAEAGVYLTMPQGHALLTDGARSLVVTDMGGAVDVGGVQAADPDDLEKLGRHLVQLAERMRARSVEAVAS